MDNTLRFTRVISHYDPFVLEDNEEMKFMAPVYLKDAGLHDFLEDCCRATRHIGTSRNRGLGNVLISVCKDDFATGAGEKKTEESEESGCRGLLMGLEPEKKVKITFHIRLDAPVTLPGCDELNTSIPARSVIGCLAGNYLRKGSAEDGIFRSLFLNGDVSWSALTPVIGGVISDPAPMMLVKLKNDGNRLINHLSEKNSGWKSLKPKTLDGAFASMHFSSEGNDIVYSIAEPQLHTVYHYALNGAARDQDGGSEDETGELYMQDSIDAGMVYGGTVNCTAKMAEEVIRCLTESEFRFGRSRSAQYAACSLKGHPNVEVDPEYRIQIKEGELVYVILKSDLALLKDGIFVTDAENIRKALAHALGVSEEMPSGGQDYCRYHTVGGYQVLWHLQKPQIPVVRAGSVYCFEASGKSLPGSIQVGQFAQEGFGVCRILGETEMRNASCVKKGSIDRAEYEGNPARLHAVYIKLLAESGVETIRRYALDYPIAGKRLPVGRLRLMLSQAEEYPDLLRMIGTIKESDVSSENEISRKKISEDLVKGLYAEDGNSNISWKKLLKGEAGLWEEIQRHPEAEKLLWENWKVPLEIILHKQYYQKER